MGPSLLTDTSQLIALITAFFSLFSRSLSKTVWELRKVCWPELSREMIRLSLVTSDQHLSQPALLPFKLSRLKSPVRSGDTSFEASKLDCWVTVVTMITLGPWTSQKWQRATIADMVHSNHVSRLPSHCSIQDKLLITNGLFQPLCLYAFNENFALFLSLLNWKCSVQCGAVKAQHLTVCSCRASMTVTPELITWPEVMWLIWQVTRHERKTADFKCATAELRDAGHHREGRAEAKIHCVDKLTDSHSLPLATGRGRDTGPSQTKHETSFTHRHSHQTGLENTFALIYIIIHDSDLTRMSWSGISVCLCPKSFQG